MHEKYFCLALVVVITISSPVAASLTKIAAGAPVYIGEQNLDISSGLQGCHVIGWWPEGADPDTAPLKQVTVIPSVEESAIAFSYRIDPKFFSGFAGTWYCVDKKPRRAVFELREPRLVIRVWDLDNNRDITGKTVPLITNITYRIDTNLDAALQYRFRPDITPADTFFSVNMTDPRGRVLSSLYTGTIGKSDTHMIALEPHPFISSSPYEWKEGGTWNHLSRGQGEYLYPAGTYTFRVTQNLNRMQEMYAGSLPEDREDHLESVATVTFSGFEPESVQTAAIPAGFLVTTAGAPQITMSPAPISATMLPAATVIPARTTYAPLSPWITAAGLATALFAAAWLKR